MIKVTNDELCILNENVNIREANLEYHNDPMLRVYRSSPDAITIQIRAYCGIGEFGDGVKRNMNATAYLSIDEAQRLIRFLESRLTVLKQFAKEVK